jgi:GT2 family glycosyltransferase
MLFRRETVEQTHGFDLDYRMYVEEIDWCMRIRRAGWPLYCVPSAEIVHFEGQSTRQVRPEMVEALWRSRFLLFERYYSRAFCRAARRVVRAGFHTRIAQTRAALARGEMADQDAGEMMEAYRRVIELAGNSQAD